MEIKSFGKNYSISTKHSIAICNFIRGKTISDALFLLEKVTTKRVAVPMKGEIPHRKGKGMERGRYPVKASSYFIKLIKNLRGNAAAKNLDADAVVIKLAKADKAGTPPRIGRKGRTGARTHILLMGEGREVAKEKPKAKEVEKKPEVKEEKKEQPTTESKEEKKENVK